MRVVRLQPWTKSGALAAIALTIALGNLRTSASIAELPITPGTGSLTTAMRSVISTGLTSESAAEIADGDESDDRVRLVPAIYARDPEVRFVFFRNVSKWM